jgi:hypothetical protein
VQLFPSLTLQAWIGSVKVDTYWKIQGQGVVGAPGPQSLGELSTFLPRPEGR